MSMKVRKLKRQLKSRYRIIQDTQSGDGGRHITDVVTGGAISNATREFNTILAELKELDPEAKDLPYLSEK